MGVDWDPACIGSPVHPLYSSIYMSLLCARQIHAFLAELGFLPQVVQCVDRFRKLRYRCKHATSKLLRKIENSLSAIIMNLGLFKFFISQRVPRGLPHLFTETFASQRSDPSTNN